MRRVLTIAAEWTLVAGLALVVGATFAAAAAMYAREHLRRTRA